jgi:hypothetical protein
MINLEAVMKMTRMLVRTWLMTVDATKKRKRYVAAVLAAPNQSDR